MKEKYIHLLEEQIHKLEEKNFNPDAWKKHTIIILEHVFGENNKKIKAIDAIRFDQGSWTLRDTSGASAIETYRNMGREILEATIFEIKNFGIPGEAKTSELNEIIIESIQNELTGSQYKDLQNLLTRDIPLDDKRESLLKTLKTYDSSVPVKILANVLINSKLKFKE